MKRVISVLLSLMLLAVVSSCGSPSDSAPEPDVGGEPVTLSWYVNYSWFTTPWGQNAVSKAITEQTGVDIRFIVPTGSETEKLDSMIVSNTLPDIITLWSLEPKISEMISSGLVYPLNELADEYDRQWYEVTNKGRLDWFTQPDGNIYGYPNSSFSYSDFKTYDKIYSNQTFLVRKDIYEAIGSPDMTTPEGFIQAVRDAAKLFPEVDGQPLIPVGAHEFTREGCDSFDRYLMNFLAVPSEKDGRAYDRFTDPEYIRWLKVFRQLTEEGYLLPDIFWDKRVQMGEKVANGRYFCMLYQRTDIADQQKALYAKNPERVYIAVDGPRNSNGDNHTLPCAGISGWTQTFVTKNCQHPDKAIELMTYLMSEQGQKMVYLGIEGLTYDMVGGNPVIQPDVQEILDTDRTAYNKIYGADNTYWMLMDNAMQIAWSPEPSEPMAQPELWTRPYTVYAAQYDYLFNTDTEFGDINRKVAEAWGKTLPQLLTAKSEQEFDELYASFVNTRDGYGYASLVNECTRQMVESKKRLGID